MINICIGTEPRTEIARKVLEYSILSQASAPITFHSLNGQDFYDRGIMGQGTGFSFMRFCIPEKFNYQGKAIYLDSDMLCLTDIKNLYDLAKEESNVVWCKLGNEKKHLAETSMMIIDNKNAKDRMKSLTEIQEYLKDDKDRKKYREIMKLEYLNPKPIEISRYWNVMDKGCLYSNIKDFSSKKAKILHFTSVQNQPWYNPKHPAAGIWIKWLKKSIQAGYVDKSEILIGISKFDISNPKRPNGIHPYYKNI